MQLHAVPGRQGRPAGPARQHRAGAHRRRHVGVAHARRVGRGHGVQRHLHQRRSAAWAVRAPDIRRGGRGQARDAGRDARDATPRARGDGDGRVLAIYGTVHRAVRLRDHGRHRDAVRVDSTLRRGLLRHARAGRQRPPHVGHRGGHRDRTAGRHTRAVLPPRHNRQARVRPGPVPDGAVRQGA